MRDAEKREFFRAVRLSAAMQQGTIADLMVNLAIVASKLRNVAEII